MGELNIQTEKDRTDVQNEKIFFLLSNYLLFSSKSFSYQLEKAKHKPLYCPASSANWFLTLAFLRWIGNQWQIGGGGGGGLAVPKLRQHPSLGLSFWSSSTFCTMV